MKKKIENVFQGVKAFVVDVEGVMVLGQNVLSRSFSSDVLT